MRAVLLCIVVLLACTPAVAQAQSATVGTTPAPAATTTTPGAVTIAPAESSDNGPSPAVVGLVVLLALGVVVLVCWAIARLTAWEPGWLPRVRHATGEAAYRWGGAWAQLRDWVRLSLRR
jgi:hypothetical protein